MRRREHPLRQDIVMEASRMIPGYPFMRGTSTVYRVKKGGFFPVSPGAFLKKRDSISRRVHEGEDEKEDQAANEEEEGMVPTKDPLRRLRVESNHQPFDDKSNALPLAPPGLEHPSTPS